MKYGQAPILEVDRIFNLSVFSWPHSLMLWDTTKTIASTLAVRNHGAVADTIGTGTATTGGTGHAGVTKWIVFCRLVSLRLFSHKISPHLQQLSKPSVLMTLKLSSSF